MDKQKRKEQAQFLPCLKAEVSLREMMKTVTPYPQQMSGRFIVYDWAHAVGTELIEKLGFKDQEETTGNILDAIKVFHENNILVMTKVGNDCMVLCIDTPHGSFHQR